MVVGSGQWAVGSVKDVMSGIALDPKPRPHASRKIDETAKSFEAMFLTQMLEHMDENAETDSLMGDPESDDIYRGWMNEQYARAITDAGGIGIADYVKQAMLKLQEVQS